jgi:hypothetical protein
MHERMKNPGIKLVVGLVLLTAAGILMCAGTRWLFFLGLALGAVSAWFSLRPRIPVGRLRGLIGWLGCIGAVALFLWLSSFGRKPLPWAGACAGIFAVGMTELEHWRATRRATGNA